MPTSSYYPQALHVVSPPVAAYVEATNSCDLEGLVDLFADDALVSDQLRYWRKPAIREWAAGDIIGQRLTMDVTAVIEHYESLILTANVGGNSDMTGPRDPLGCAFFFTVQVDRIVRLIILRNRDDALKATSGSLLTRSIRHRRLAAPGFPKRNR